MKKTPTSIHDFFSCLEKAGVPFKKSLYTTENESFEDVIRLNQAYLDRNESSYTTEYISIELKHEIFTDPVLFVGNDKRSKTFVVGLSLPEEELLADENGSFDPSVIIKNQTPPSPREDLMEIDKSIAISLWTHTAALCVQTFWEASDTPPAFYKIRRGIPPQCEPFAIVPCSVAKKSWKAKGQQIARDGLLIEEKGNWRNVFCDVDAWIQVKP